MNQNSRWGMTRTAMGILFALSLSHCLNDLLQSIIMAVYPLLKEDLLLNFAQIGLITLVYQIAASVFNLSWVCIWIRSRILGSCLWEWDLLCWD